MCLYPRLITNPKYKPNKKNGGKPPFPTDNRVTQVPIACGNCIECRKQTSRQDGVPPETNIRTDRFDLAVEGHDKMAKDRLAKRVSPTPTAETPTTTDTGSETAK